MCININYSLILINIFFTTDLMCGGIHLKKACRRVFRKGTKIEQKNFNGMDSSEFDLLFQLYKRIYYTYYNRIHVYFTSFTDNQVKRLHFLNL